MKPTIRKQKIFGKYEWVIRFTDARLNYNRTISAWTFQEAIDLLAHGYKHGYVSVCK